MSNWIERFFYPDKKKVFTEEEATALKAEHPDNVPEEKVIAPAGKRLFAFMIDFTIINLTLAGIANLFYPEDWDILPEADQLRIFWPVWILAVVLYLLKDFVNSRSLGKYFLNLYVAEVQEGLPKATGQKLILRNLTLIIAPVEAFLLLSDKYCRRIGDKWMGTFVVEVKMPPQVRKLTVKVLAGMLTVSVMWSFYIYTAPLRLKRAHGYRIVAQAAQTYPKLLDVIGEFQEFDYWPQEVTDYGDKVYYVLLAKGSKGERKVQITLSKKTKPFKISKISVLAGDESEPEGQRVKEDAPQTESENIGTQGQADSPKTNPY